MMQPTDALLAPALRRPRVAIAYHQVAHYRRAVFDELMRSERYEFVILSDVHPPDPSIALVDPNETGWPWIVTPNRWFGPFLWQRGLVRQALFGRFDAFLMLGNFLYLSTWVAALAARLRGRRVLLWGHGWLREEPGLRGRLRRSFYSLADALCVYGHFAKSIGIEYGFSADRIHVVYNSLDYAAQCRARDAVSQQRIREVRAELFEQPEIPIVICSARLVARRRLDILIEAAARLAECDRPVNVLLVGDGPARPDLETLGRRRGVSVCFYGSCYDPVRMAELTLASDLTVVPNALGLTAIQSLTFGRPVVTHGDREGQGPEQELVIPGRTGGFFRRDDSEDLARAIAEWTHGESDRAAVALTCNALIERFWNPVMQRRVIERALAGLPADDLFWQHEKSEAAPPPLPLRS